MIMESNQVMLSLKKETRRNTSSTPLVVCVDDNEFVLEILNWYLESQGYNVVQCPDAARAVEVVDQRRPDAVTVDFEMPVMDGGAVAAAIKSKHPQLPIVMFSGSSEIPQRALESVDCFVSKDSINSFAAVASALESVLVQKKRHRPMQQTAMDQKIA